MQRLVECVPNFSEGRNARTVRALVDAVRNVKGVFVLDEEMDHDHHRAVLTFVGEPDAVAEAAFQAARMAVSLIDLRLHQGGHPRVGATDVVPFVPIRGVTMDECVQLARKLGGRIGGELAVPVYLYERAATRPERVNLEVIRRGGPQGLAARMEADPAWRPDFGPLQLHPSAGATIVGARLPLIAFNVNLQTDDLAVAKTIAKTVRFSGGGLPHVKAIGVELASRRLVQVSINLTNFEETPLQVAFEAVREEAERRGVRVCSSELIGLVPQQALVMAAEFFLKLERFDPTQVLETRLERVMAREAQASETDLAASVSEFLEALSAGTAAPGGGSVAALAGSLAAALGVMVCRISTPAGQEAKKPPPRAEERSGSERQMLERRLAGLQNELQGLVQADAAAYASVVKAFRLARTDPARQEAISASLRAATEVPLKTAALASDTVSILRQLSGITKPAVASDLKVGIIMGLAAIEAALENVKTNLETLKNDEYLREVSQRVEAIKQSVVELKTL